MTEKRANSRIRVLVVVFAVLFAVTLGRAAWIQVVDGNAYAAMASKQQRETIEIPAGRGTILDRTGEPLAIGELATTVYARHNDRQKGGLGLMRLAAESKFQLSTQYTEGLLVIRAHLSMEGLV